MTDNAARRLLADFRQFAGRRFLSLSLLMVGGALAEGLGIAMLAPLLALAGGSGLPQLSAMLGTIPGWSPATGFVLALGLFLSLMLVRALLLYRRDVAMARLEAEYTADMRLRAAASLARGGWGEASRVGLAGMQSLLLTEIPRCIYAAHEVQMAAVSAVLLIVQFGVAALLSPSLAAVAFLIILLGLAASWRLIKRSHRRGVAISAHGEQSSSAGFRLHAGLKAALAQGTTAEFLQEYGRDLASLSGEMLGFSRDRARTRALASVAAAAAAVVLMLIGHQWLHLPFALLATSLVLFARMSGPAQSLQQSIHGFSAHAPALDAIERTVGRLRREEWRTEREAEPAEWCELKLCRLSYGHPHGDFRLSTGELSIRSGEWVGLSGPSGGGKTTMVDLAVGLLAPSEGVIELDGRPLDQASLPGWRRGVAYVGQNEMLFDASVRRNLLAGSSQRHEDEALWEVIQIVGLRDRILQMDSEMDSELGDRGSSLSGGERQRLMLARALLRRPRLLVLDEATNALDQESEMALLRRLRAMEPRPALFLVAHRAAPLELCDRVIRVDAGQLHES